MIRELFEWWVTQLTECIPQQLRHAAASRQDAVLVAPVGPLSADITVVAISIRSKRKETPLGQFALTARDLAAVPKQARAPTILQLSSADILCKTITLPLATERDLAQVLAFEMDRETPFHVDEVFWSYRVVGRDKARGQLTVRLLLVVRSILAPLLETLEEAGFPLEYAYFTGGLDDGLSLPLNAAGISSERQHGRHTLRWASAATCGALAVAAAAAPFIRQSWDFAKTDRAVAAGRATAAQAEQLREEIDHLESAGNVLEKERTANGDPLATLAALTAALPDDTYVTALQQQQHKVTISGRSAAASRLIGAVARGAQLRNPSFVAPVTRMEASHTEVFSISAETGP